MSSLSFRSILYLSFSRPLIFSCFARKLVLIYSTLVTSRVLPASRRLESRESLGLTLTRQDSLVEAPLNHLSFVQNRSQRVSSQVFDSIGTGNHYSENKTLEGTEANDPRLWSLRLYRELDNTKEKVPSWFSSCQREKNETWLWNSLLLITATGLKCFQDGNS